MAARAAPQTYMSADLHDGAVPEAAVADDDEAEAEAAARPSLFLKLLSASRHDMVAVPAVPASVCGGASVKCRE